MLDTDVLLKQMFVMRLPDGKRKIAQRVKVQERPASFGHFTFKEILQMVHDIQYNPFKDVYYHKFSHGRYMVRLRDKEDIDE